jgi:hypothetical protein
MWIKNGTVGFPKNTICTVFDCDINKKLLKSMFEIKIIIIKKMAIWYIPKYSVCEKKSKFHKIHVVMDFIFVFFNFSVFQNPPNFQCHLEMVCKPLFWIACDIYDGGTLINGVIIYKLWSWAFDLQVFNIMLWWKACILKSPPFGVKH